MIQYEHVFELNDKLYAREYNTDTKESSIKMYDKNDYVPPVFIPFNGDSEFRSHVNFAPLKKIDFSSTKDYYKFIKDNEDFLVIHGNKNIPQEYIRRNYPNPLESDHEFRTWFIDIETRSVDGMSDGETASEEISLIQFYDNFDKTYYVLGHKEYKNEYNSKYGKVVYKQYDSEKELMKDFVRYTRSKNPTVWVGFNSFSFDFPYIINRLKRLKIAPELLSPVGVIETSEQETKDKIAYIHYDIKGRILLDYRELYRKYSYEKLPKYSLEEISNHELGEGKVLHDEYDSWEIFYLTDHQKFVEYGIRDIEVLIMLDEKLRLISTAKFIGYLCGVCIPDVMGTIKQWNSLVFNEGYKQGFILPLKQQFRNEADKFPGGWIGSQSGKYDYVASFDFKALYPSVIMMLNLGVDTLVKPHEETEELKYLREKYFSWYDEENFLKLKSDNCHPEEHERLMYVIQNKEEIHEILERHNVTASPNGYFYRKEKEGLFANLLRNIVDTRQKSKKEVKKLESEINELIKNFGDQDKIEELTKEKDFHALHEYVLKILANSAYGSLSMNVNQFSHGKGFSSATTTGGRWSNRLANHYMSNKLSEIMKVENKTGYDFTVLNHTDSGYINLSELMYKLIEKQSVDKSDTGKILSLIDGICIKILQPCIDQAIADINYALNVFDPHALEMEKEVLSDGMVVATNGKYYCRYYKKDENGVLKEKHKIVGLSLINKSTPPFCKEKLKPVLNMILDKEPMYLVDYIEEVRDEFEKVPIETISVIKGVSNIDYPLRGYKREVETEDKLGNKVKKLLTAPIHSRGAIIHNKVIDDQNLPFIKIRNGDKIYYTTLKVPNKEAYNQDVISYLNPKFMVDSGLMQYVDYDTLFDKNFVKNIELITEPIGWSLNKYQGLADEWC